MGGMNFIEVGPGAIGTKGFWGLKKTHPTEKGHEQIYFFLKDKCHQKCHLNREGLQWVFTSP
ncbi:MAG: hypothetical protein ACI9UO_002734 [Nitrospinales bacterium]|jgi:hypothetical protein